MLFGEVEVVLECQPSRANAEQRLPAASVGETLDIFEDKKLVRVIGDKFYAGRKHKLNLTTHRAV
ncbi:MAG: hypothetical protein ABJP07_06355 [Parvibaculum sp.]|uniref:hypothetical protein n=1 Tax=Parvibaculum sp. TaxID=2024848 RepID=UPI00329745BA